MLSFLLLYILYGDALEKRYYCMDSALQISERAILTGTLHHTDIKSKSFYLFLKDVSVRVTNVSESFVFSDFLVVSSKDAAFFYEPGSRLQITGRLSVFETPSSLGQFDEKSYYKELNIYYKLTADTISRHGSDQSRVRTLLYLFRYQLASVYQSCLEPKEAGIFSAMLLGEKSLLDADMKDLYQASGIAHILAISGLHITILCTLLYRFLFFLRLPRPLPFLVTVLFLLGYGMMTGFGISTSRAVIMMVLLLLAGECGRSYDAPTAMATSALVILLQKPYALFSCSFLLSFSATAGVQLVYPAAQAFFLGPPEKQRERKRKKEHKRKELPFLHRQFYILLQKLASSLLFSFSIWIATLPILLYFFYEVPTYGILLNLFVLPLISVVVIFALLGGLAGLFCLPLANFILFPAAQILTFYEWLCRMFQKLPSPVQVLGCPSVLQIFVYAALILCICYMLYSGRIRRLLSTAVFFAALFLLLYRGPVGGLQISMLDVGQGDGILLQEERGGVILIDGGSTSINEVGRYRIFPFLKYYGIRKIDYLVMTHADEDHISGQLELLKGNGTNGITVGGILLPELSAASVDSGYQAVWQAAVDAHVPVSYFNTGATLYSGLVQLLCLHPDAGYTGSSANACSLTLQLTYKSFSMLLTGDLEAEGEEAVLRQIGDRQNGYTVLKVAHHGSKNSTGEAFLSAVRPKLALISCGRQNRYGHPHEELLARLQECRTEIYRTDVCGLVRVVTDGEAVWVKPYLSGNR